jgi:hypothetical protein
MLECKPQHYIKYWKLSKDRDNNNTLELITNDSRHLVLKNHYVLLWQLINGFNSVETIVSDFCQLFNSEEAEKVKEIVCKSLQQMDEAEIILLNWNPFSKE